MTIAPDQVSAVLVTRGDVDMRPVLDSLPFADVWVWDNSVREDLAVYGRYAAIAEAEHDVVFVQDDDCVLAPDAFEALLAAYEPGTIVANMPARFRQHYTDSCLVGFGALFDADLPARAFTEFASTVPTLKLSNYGWWLPGDSPDHEHFHRTCDVVVTTLTPRKLVDVAYADREFASAPNRMWKQPGHHAERVQMLELARRVRDRVTA